MVGLGPSSENHESRDPGTQKTTPAGTPASNYLFKPQDLAKVSYALVVFVVGFMVLRLWIIIEIAKRFGASEVADVLFIALLIPVNLFLQNRKAILLGFVPVYTEYILYADEEKFWHFTSQFANLLVLAGLAFTLFYFLSVPYWMPLLTIGFAPEQREMTIQLTRLLCPAMFLFMLFAAQEGLLYSHRHFTTSNLAVLFGGVGGLLGLVFLGERYGIFGYGYGSLLGFLAQVAIPSLLFWKYRTRFSFCLNFRDPGLVKFYRLLVPVYLVSIFIALIQIASRALAATLGPGNVSALQYSGTLTWILPFVLTNSILGPLFPMISETAVRQDWERLKDMVRKGTRVLVFSVTPVVVALILVRVPVIELLFQRGEFTEGDTALTAYTLLFFAPFILTMTLSLFYTQVIVNLKLIHLAAKLTMLLFLLNLAFSLILMRPLGVGGIALSSSLTFLLQTLVAVGLIRHRIGRLGLGVLAKSGLRVLIACGLAAVPTHFFIQYVERSFDMTRLTYRLFGLSLEGLAFFLFYGCLVWIFASEDAKYFYEVVRTKREKKRSGSPVPTISGE